MGLFSKEIETMDDLLLHGLKDIYYAENQIVKSLPGLIDKATNRDLTKGLKDHLEEQLAALRFTPLRRATADIFLSAAFSSLRLVLRRRTMSLWPTASAHAIRVP